MAETIQSYLISLGYSIDQNQRRQFKNYLSETASSVRSLGLATAGTATAMGVAVLKINRDLDELYQTSQRTKASAEGIRAFGFAASQMGSDAGSATGSLEGFARFLRENGPGAERLVQSLGVRTRNAAGGMRDTAETLQELGARLGRMPDYLAAQYGQVFGIDERTLMALRRGTGQFSAEYRQMARALGVDLGKASEESAALMREIRSLWAVFELLGYKIAQDVGPDIRAALIEIRKWIIAHQADIVRAVRMATDAFGFLLRKLGEFIIWLGDDAKRQEFVDWLNGIIAKLERLARLAVLAARALGLLDDEKPENPGNTPEGSSAEAAPGTAGEDWLTRFARRLNIPMNADGSVGTPAPGSPEAARASRPAPAVQQSRGEEALGFFMSAAGGGYTREQAAAIVTQIEAESGFNESATHDGGQGYGILGWNNQGSRAGQGRLDRLGQSIGRDARTATWQEQLRYAAWELQNTERSAGNALRNESTAASGANMLSRRWLRPAATEEAARNRANRAPYWMRTPGTPVVPPPLRGDERGEQPMPNPTAGRTSVAGGERGEEPMANPTLRSQQGQSSEPAPAVPPRPPSADTAAARATLDRWRQNAPTWMGGGGGLEAAQAGGAPSAIGGQQQGRGDVRIEQHNDIRVTGVSDPNAAARRTGEAMQDVNGQLLRNTQGAVR